MSQSQLRQCTACKKLLPATLEFFSPEKRTKLGLKSWCKECFNDRRRLYRLGHGEAERAYQKTRRQEYPDRERLRLKKWRRANPDKAKAQHQRYHEAHREQVNALARMRAKALYLKHPEIWTIATHKRRALLKASGGTFTAPEWEELKAKYGHTCLRCGRHEPEIELTVDHVIPLSRGGGNIISNIQPLCRSCNASKKANVADYRELIAARTYPNKWSDSDPDATVLIPQTHADGTVQDVLLSELEYPA